MKVFLDLDGVLVDFVSGACKALGKANPYPQKTRDYAFWNIWPDISFTNVDAICTSDFFAGLRWMPDGRRILELIEKNFGQENIYLVSTVMPNSQSFMGRMLWINRYLPQYSGKTWLGRIPKSFLAGPDTLLVDDKDENIAGFVAAGGQGILVPRPWNKLRGWAGESLQVVKNSLEAL